MQELTQIYLKEMKMTKQEILERVQIVLNQARGQYPWIGDLDLLRHDLENDIIEESYETN